MNLTRTITINPAFDKRNDDPKKDYGIHGCDLLFVLKGERGAVQFLVYTNWHLPHVADEMANKPVRDAMDIKIRFMPMAADLGYHSPVARYDGQDMMTGSCEHLDGKPCYYDGSGLNAEPIYEVMLREGSDGVWRELEKFYDEIFSHDEQATPAQAT